MSGRKGPPIHTEDPHLTWFDRAKCRGLDAELFFPHRGDGDTMAAARAVCAECTVTVECLHYAVTTHQDDGVWAGTSGRQRQRLRAADRMRVLICEWCHTKVRLPRTLANANRHYCSDGCATAARRQYIARQRRNPAL